MPSVPPEILELRWPVRLERFEIRTGSGALVPLSNVASITKVVEPNALTNFQQLNSATLTAVPFPGRTVGEAVDFLKKVAAEKFPEGFTYDFQGESRQYVQEGNALVYTFDTQREQTGIATLMRRLNEQGIDFKDLHSSESSLEEIFVSLVHGNNGGRA